MIVDFETYTDADLVQGFVHQTAAGAPINLTGYSLRMQVRLAADDPTVYVECSTFNGRIVITDAVTGAFTVKIPVSLLVNLPPGKYTHSLIKTAPTLLRTPVWRGTLTHQAGPTRWALGEA